MVAKLDNKMATSNVVATIEPVSKSTNFDRWVQRFEAVKMLQEWTTEKAKHAFLAYIGQEAFNLLADAAVPKKPADFEFNELVDLLK